MDFIVIVIVFVIVVRILTGFIQKQIARLDEKVRREDAAREAERKRADDLANQHPDASLLP